MSTPNTVAERREFIRESKAAIVSDQTLEERALKREGKADEWAQWLRRRMDAAGCSDPAELMPEICAQIEQAAEDCVAAAVRELKTTLLKALKL
jgi:hypothetical protein